MKSTMNRVSRARLRPRALISTSHPPRIHTGYTGQYKSPEPLTTRNSIGSGGKGTISITALPEGDGPRARMRRFHDLEPKTQSPHACRVWNLPCATGARSPGAGGHPAVPDVREGGLYSSADRSD